MFEHKFLNFAPLDVETLDTGRSYVTPSGARLQSVTTILGLMADRAWKAEWIARVGEEEAARTLRTAQIRGRGVHALAESFLRNEDTWKASLADNPFEGAAFESIRKILAFNIGTIYGIEAPVFSERLGTAGRLDLLCDWAGKPAIVDFKTSRRIRNEALLHNYFLQATAYGVMVEELHPGINIQNIVIMVMPEYEPLPQIEIRRKDTFVTSMESVFARFRRVLGGNNALNHDSGPKQALPA